MTCHPVKSQPMAFNSFSFTLHHTFNINKIRAFFSYRIASWEETNLYTGIKGSPHCIAFSEILILSWLFCSTADESRLPGITLVNLARNE